MNEAPWAMVRWEENKSSRSPKESRNSPEAFLRVQSEIQTLLKDPLLKCKWNTPSWEMWIRFVCWSKPKSPVIWNTCIWVHLIVWNASHKINSCCPIFRPGVRVLKKMQIMRPSPNTDSKISGWFQWCRNVKFFFLCKIMWGCAVLLMSHFWSGANSCRCIKSGCYLEYFFMILCVCALFRKQDLCETLIVCKSREQKCESWVDGIVFGHTVGVKSTMTSNVIKSHFQSLRF